MTDVTRHTDLAEEFEMILAYENGQLEHEEMVKEVHGVNGSRLLHGRNPRTHERDSQEGRMTYEYHAKCENKDCRDYSFLFAVVTQAPVLCRVCGQETKVVAIHPVKEITK